MFTGIIQEVGTISAIEASSGDGKRMTIGYDSEDVHERLSPGESIAVDGVCLTVVDYDSSEFSVDVSEESLSCTTLKERDTGQLVNLEPSLRVGDSLGGHFVFGHVDDVVSVLEFSPDAEYHDLTVELPDKFRTHVAPKGSLALNGISLTINEVTPEQLTVKIVPHTIKQTSLSQYDTGDSLNLEIDMLARYVSNHLKQSEQNDRSTGLTADQLIEAGFDN